MPSLPLLPIPVEHLQHVDARWLLAYWKSKQSGDALPRCEWILAHEIQAVAPHLIRVEPTGLGCELRYRSVGAAITSRFAVDLTGKTLPWNSPGGWAAAIRQSLAERHPVAVSGKVSGGRTSWARFEALALPLDCPAGGGMGALVGLFFFEG